MRKKRLYLLLAVLLIATLFPLPVSAQRSGDLVYVVPIHGTIEKGLSNFVKRAFDDATRSNSKLIVLDIETPGGFTDAAEKIEKIISQSPIPTSAYVTAGALSAGALIAFAADELIMAPGTTIGAAEPRLGTEKADEKYVSAWAGKLAAAAAASAEKNGRDPERASEIAAAMADADLAIPGVVEKGKLLTLTDRQALELGMSDGIMSSLDEVLTRHELENATIIEFSPSLAERLARWVTSPMVMPVLLTIGLAGLVIEIFTIGFGIPGTIGLIALGLFFGGSMLAGMSGWEAILVFILGLILLGVEVLVLPGFGIVGIGGLGAMIISIILAAPSLEQAIISLVLAILGTIVLLFLSIKLLPSRRVWQRLVLGVKQEKEEGYVAPSLSLQNLVGTEGISVSPLRPAGAIEVDGERIDVVTDGNFVPVNTPVKVVKVEGTRVIVRRKE
ncbi:MAG TPA: nodulation protein NfeD [Clostridia bacterium]|nr:nodulation protein NfeD [Clostridia bacterium]